MRPAHGLRSNNISNGLGGFVSVVDAAYTPYARPFGIYLIGPASRSFKPLSRTVDGTTRFFPQKPATKSLVDKPRKQGTLTHGKRNHGPTRRLLRHHAESQNGHSHGRRRK